MAVTRYSISLLEYEDCPLRVSHGELSDLLKAWRNGQRTSDTCSGCGSPVVPTRAGMNFAICCNSFYYLPTKCYSVRSIAVETPGYTYALPHLAATIAKRRIQTNQEYLVLPDPIYWQVSTTLVYDKVLKFSRGLPMTKRTKNVQPASKAPAFYRQVEEAPLNHGSIHRRSGGKNTLYRQIAYGKRCSNSLRATIVACAQLRPDEIAIPGAAGIPLGRWVIINRMPSLTPENFVALRVAEIWAHECFGIPLEVVEQMNADFDGDECNLYVVEDAQSQAECATLLDSRSNMGSYVSGLKLNPSQDMLVAYHLFHDRIDFLPYKDASSLKRTFRVIYDLYGSETTFECIDRMRLFYLEAMQRDVAFGLTLREMRWLVESAAGRTYEQFREAVRDSRGCLAIQVAASAKGSVHHIYEMFGSLGLQNGFRLRGSFWKGLTPAESVLHAATAFDAMLQSSRIWEPGYGYSKSVYSLQGLTVDYLGRLVDGKAVVENDVLDVMHHADLMSTDAFKELMRTRLPDDDDNDDDDSGEGKGGPLPPQEILGRPRRRSE